MSELNEDTKKTLLIIIDSLLQDTISKASQTSLFNFVNYNKSITMELFSQNIEEYLHFMISQSITTSFSTGLKKMIVECSELFVKIQGGQILKNPDPFHLKFKLKSGEEYCIEIMSKNEQNFTSDFILNEHKVLAENKGKKYRLFIYDDTEYPSDEEFRLNSNDYWELIAGYKNAKQEMDKLLNGAANKLSISSLIKDTNNRLLSEWRMQ